MRTDPVERLGRRAKAAGVPFAEYLAALPAWDPDVSRLARELSGRPFRAERPWWRSPPNDMTLRELANEIPNELYFAAIHHRTRAVA